MRRLIAILNATPVRWGIALTWLLVLTIVLVQPLDRPIIPTGVKPAPPSFGRELAFSTLHALAFVWTCLLWSWTLHRHVSIRTAAWLAAVSLFVYGIGTEFAQTLTPGRAPQGIDILANAIGVGVGTWLYIRLARE